MSRATVTRTPDGGAILHDASRWPAAPAPEDFLPSTYHARGAVLGEAGGRGTAHRVRTAAGEAVLRHYHRGGRVARLLGDRYLWTGLERTRAYQEYRVLERAGAEGLPVPAPLAARVARRGPWYRADLLVAAIPDAQTLAARVGLGAPVPWRAVGGAIARMHDRGLWHADLNAHNVLLAGDAVWLVDFDRARFEALGPATRRANVARLERSLRKIGAPESVARYDQALAELHAGYVDAAR